MIEEKKIFTGGINADDAYFLHADGDYNNAINCDFVRHTGKKGRVEPVVGNRKIDNNDLAPSGSITIGSAEDLTKNRLYYFVYNEGGDHGIYCYEGAEGIVRTVLLDGDVEGGLNFSADHLINGAFVVNNVLYWNDGLNEQRRINVEAAMRAYDSGYETEVSQYDMPLSRQHLSLIRREPGLPLAIEKTTVSDSVAPSNQIADDVFQFSYRYIYRDNEVSRLAPLSILANRNTPDELWNAIDITVPVEETINQDVARIEFVVKNLVVNQFYIFKTITVSKSQAAVDAHNAGTTPLVVQFLNDTVGVAIADSQANIQFDSVPLVSKTMEIANSRIFLGNNLEGYDSPDVSSLQATIVEAGGSVAVIGRWFKLRFNTVCGANPPAPYTVYLLDITGISGQDGYYEWVSGTVPPFPASVLFTDLVFRGAGLFDVMNAVGVGGPGCQNVITEFSYQDAESSITGAPPAEVAINDRVFKSASAYKIGIAFHDFAGRKCGVYTSDDLRLVTPDRTFSDASYVTGFSWTLQTTNMIDEIPEWAHYYSINITKCLRTRFFMSMRADDLKYADKDANGDWTYDDTPGDTKRGIAVSISSLFNFGMGYEYSDGDIIKIYPSTTAEVYYQKVVGQDGDYVICDYINLGDLSTVNALYEIYTPYRELGNEPYYEVSEIYKVNNPETDQRSYSVLTGTIEGDVFLKERTVGGFNYLVEVMSLIDRNWKEWWTDHGRPNFIDPIGQVRKVNNISYSNQYINGTKVNGLSAFDPLDETNEVPLEGGEIQKLSLVTKPQEPGTVMLCISEHETSSLYLGEAEVQGGVTILAKTDGVIGSVNVLKGGFGTCNHESVAKWRSNVFWWDLNRGTVVMYGANGLETPGEYKMDTTFRKIAEDILNSGSKQKVIGGVNPSTGEYIIVFPHIRQVLESDVLYDQTKELVYSGPQPDE